MDIKNKTFISIGIEKIDIDKFEKVSNSGSSAINKPNGGFWACPYYPKQEYKSQWHLYIKNNYVKIKEDKAVIFKLKKDAKIYIADNINDLESLWDIFPAKCPPVYENTLIKKRWIRTKIIDFKKMSNYYDGFFLTDKCRNENCWNSGINTWGWDVESLVLFNLDCIQEWQKKRL